MPTLNDNYYFFTKQLLFTMAKITRSLSSKRDGNGKSEILLRVYADRDTRLRVKTGLYVDPARFRDGGFVWPKVNQRERAELKETERKLTDMERKVIDYCELNPGKVTKDGIEYCIDPNRAAGRTKSKTSKEDNDQQRECEIVTLMELCIQSKKITYGTAKTYRVLARALWRFELYKRRLGDKSFALTVKGLTEPLKCEIRAFLKDETPIYNMFPEIYESLPAGAGRSNIKPTPRGRNTLINLYKKFAVFAKWCNAMGYSSIDPDLGVKNLGAEIYGDPYYITTAERDTIRDYDMSNAPGLEVQRDIFIFQCYAGCRISDLMSLTAANVVEGWLYYIPQKTVEKKADTVRVPLRPTAIALIEKYKGADKRGRLFPFCAEQKYNQAIKRIFRMCGITRNITRLNPKTKKPEQVPICDVASSHMARRTFIGNMYQDVKDPNIIGAMSGHVSGSKAFARYRNITDDVLKDAIKNL